MGEKRNVKAYIGLHFKLLKTWDAAFYFAERKLDAGFIHIKTSIHLTRGAIPVERVMVADVIAVMKDMRLRSLMILG